MSILSFLSFIVFIIYMHIGLSIFKDNKDIIEHKMFLGLCISFSIWSLPFVFMHPGLNEYQRELLLKISELGACSFSAILLHLILIVCKSKFIEIRNHKKFIYLPLFIFVSIRWWYFGVENVDSSTYEVYEIAKKIYYAIYTLIGMYIGYSYYRSSKVLREKRSIQVLFFTGILTLTIGITYTILEVLFKAYKFPDIHHIFPALWVGMTWYCFNTYSYLNVQAISKDEVIFDKLKDIICILDCNAIIVSVNYKFIDITELKKQNIIGQPISTLINGLNIDYKAITESTDLELVERSDCKLITRTNKYIPVNLSVTRVLDRVGQIVGAVVVAQDMRLVKKLESEIEENIKIQKALSYLSYHDSLTGLLNRTSFEDWMRKLEGESVKTAGIVICDLDGLKLINDTLGHKDGDELIMSAAEAVSKALTTGCLAARIGGDEFAIVMENASEQEMKHLCNKICMNIEEYNNRSPKLPLSMSVGYSIRDNGRTMKDTFKEADNNMYRKKLLQSHNTKEAIVKTLIKAIKSKDFIEQGHAERLFDIMVDMAEIIGLPEYKINNLWLMAQFHDIGKVGISDSILFKPGILTSEEFNELKRHCEIGYRIARNSPEIEPIAEHILKHHEWWNGNGYPLGLKGEEIPVECRLFSIADAYDVMTTERPYRNALDKSEAIDEILSCRGKQFDPNLALMFVEVIKNKDIIRV